MILIFFPLLFCCLEFAVCLYSLLKTDGHSNILSVCDWGWGLGSRAGPWLNVMNIVSKAMGLMTVCLWSLGMSSSNLDREHKYNVWIQLTQPVECQPPHVWQQRQSKCCLNPAMSRTVTHFLALQSACACVALISGTGTIADFFGDGYFLNTIEVFSSKPGESLSCLWQCLSHV